MTTEELAKCLGVAKQTVNRSNREKRLENRKIFQA
ncbi:YfeC-like transcriptional regulator [Shigella flexneri]